MCGIIGCAVLTMLHELDRAGELKEESKFQDLGLVMCMALEWTDGQIDLDEDDTAWRNTVVAYAKKGNIDLQSMPIWNAQKLAEDVDDDQASDVSGQSKADRWDWRKMVGCALVFKSSTDCTCPNVLSSSRSSRQNMVHKNVRTASQAWVVPSSTLRK